jgi:hypothetical protein
VPNLSQSDSDSDGVGDGCDGNPTFLVSNDPADNPDFTTIQSAVDNATQSGSHIEIRAGSGPYLGTIIVDRSMQIDFVAATGEQVVIDGGSGPAFDVRSSAGSTAVLFRNLVIRGQDGIKTLVSTRMEDVRFEAISGIALDLLGGGHEVHRVQFVVGETGGVANGIRLASGATLNLKRGRFESVTGIGLQAQGVAKLVDVLMVQGGTGILAGGGGSVDLRFATIADNSGVGFNSIGAGAVGITSSIVYGNLGGDLVGVTCATVSYSDTGSPSCAGQGGNLSAPPAFSSGYHLSGASPCLDTGPDPATYDGKTTVDLDGEMRLRDFDGLGIAESDAGAFEATNGALAPGEVMNLRWTTKTAIAWDAVTDASQYHAYRDALANRSYAIFGTCADGVIPISGTTATETAIPSAGQGYYYVFTAEDGSGNEGTMGYATGAERSDFSPCP